MGVTIIVGGQYGSEGKGKVALHFAQKQQASISVRVGGNNSGHTAYKDNKKYVLRTLPTAVLGNDVHAVIPSGGYFSVENLFYEMQETNCQNVAIDPMSVVITQQFQERELNLGLIESIGSTGSGTGAAIAQRLGRLEQVTFAKDIPELQPYLKETKSLLRQALDRGEEIILEGTQGYGLSLLHSPHYPYVTSRDTTAAGFLSETGLSPFDVTKIILVIRAFPIRVGGNSGPLPHEISWDFLTKESGSNTDLSEYTSVTGKLRRVAHFDPEIVKQAISVNQPSKIILNHMDYVDRTLYERKELTEKAGIFLQNIETAIERKIDFIGVSPLDCLER